MKNLLKLTPFAIITMGVFILNSCDKGTEETINEADYVGTYVGQHTITDPTLISVIKSIDPDQGGSFDDTIIVSSGVSPDDNIIELSSKLLNNTSVQADLSKTNSGNIVPKTIETLVISEKANVEVKNVSIKQSSSARFDASGNVNVNFNMAGAIYTDGEFMINLSNIPTAGSFKKQ